MNNNKKASGLFSDEEVLNWIKSNSFEFAKILSEASYAVESEAKFLEGNGGNVIASILIEQLPPTLKPETIYDHIALMLLSRAVIYRLFDKMLGQTGSKKI